MTTPVPILVLDQVTKRFAGHTAVDGLSLSVPTGAIYGLLGPNGAGKTTTIRMILDIIEPDAVILDEPFAGLDPVNTQVVKDAVLELTRHGVTILFSTHIMEQAEKLCDELCIIARGRKLVEGALSDIKRTRSGHHLIIGFDGSAGAAAQVFADRGLVRKVDDYGQYAEVELAAEADPQQILQRLGASGAPPSRFELPEPALHKILIDLVGPRSEERRVG